MRSFKTALSLAYLCFAGVSFGSVQSLVLHNYHGVATKAYGGTIHQGIGTVTLAAPASGDVVVSLLSDSVDLVAPSTVTVPDGQLTANFAFDLPNVVPKLETVHVTADDGEGSKTASFGVDQLIVRRYIAPRKNFVPGGVMHMTVQLATEPLNPVVVPVTGANPDVHLPSTLYFASGQQSVSFDIQVGLEAATWWAGQISIFYNGNLSKGGGPVDEQFISEVSMDTPVVVGGAAVQGTLRIKRPSGCDTFYTVTVHGPGAKPVESSIMIPATALTARFTIQTSAVKKDQHIRIVVSGCNKEKPTSLTILAPASG